jgi:hypothetical protein
MERFWSKVDKDGILMPRMDTPCWEFTGCKNPKGYGEFRYEGKKRYAHRVAYHLEHGRWPDDCLLHKCDNPSCVRLDHTFEGSRGDNNKDMSIKGRVSRTHQAVGVNHPNAVPTDHHRVLKMREIGMTYREIEKAIGCPQATIGRIVKGRHWACKQ